jgi:hypothetical protein
MDLNKCGSEEETIFTAKINSIKSFFIDANYKIILSYVGELDQNKVNTISSMVESQMINAGINKSIVKKTFNIIIEILQNICLHGEKDNNGYQMTYFIIGKTENKFLIYSGNIVSNEIVDKLKTRINGIKSLNEVDLKQRYLEVLSNGELSAKGGAGLGFLTIALKTHNNIDFNFEILNKEYSLFSLQSSVLEQNEKVSHIRN